MAIFHQPQAITLILPFAVGTMGSKDMDRSSTFLSDPAS